jgi:cysteine desulfurase / selenocysteine lyase
MLDARVKLVGIVHISNATGTINPISEIIRLAHAVGAKVLVDGAQALTHERVDVQALDVDFYTLSAHKMYGPTGIGGLYAKRELLEAMPPYQTGGSMIRTVAFDKVTYADIPEKFEPGTPNIAGVVGWGAAVDFLAGVDLPVVATEELRLAELLRDGLAGLPGIKFTGEAKHRAGIVSFVSDWAHAHDIGTLLDLDGVAVRTGHHCCMPLMKRFGVAATTRASFAMYNTEADVEQMLGAMKSIYEKFNRS